MVEARMVTSRQGARSVSLGLVFANSPMFNELELAPCISTRILSWSRNSFFSVSSWINDELGNLIAADKEPKAVKAYRRQSIIFFSMEPMGNFPLHRPWLGQGPDPVLRSLYFANFCLPPEKLLDFAHSPQSSGWLFYPFLLL